MIEIQEANGAWVIGIRVDGTFHALLYGFQSYAAAQDHLIVTMMNLLEAK